MPSDATETVVDPAEVAALLAVPQEEFVAARTARAKELRAEGRRDDAAALAKLRKPVRLVWVVGELARRHRDVAVTAADLAEEVEEAMAGGGGVRALLSRFREVVGEVAALVDEVDPGADRLQVGLALREVLADPTAREAWVEGRLLALPGDEPSSVPTDELAARRAARAKARPERAEPVHPSGQRPADAEEDEPPEEPAEPAEDPGERAEKEAALRRAEAAFAIAERASKVARDAHQEAEAAERAVRKRQAEVKAEIAALREEAAGLREALTTAKEQVKATDAVCDTRTRQMAVALADLGAAKLAADPSLAAPQADDRSRPRGR